MEILGKGHTGIVVADTPASVQKFYIAKSEGIEEQTCLDFLAEMQDEGFNIGCTIPKIVEVVGAGDWTIDDKTYTYSNRMEHVPGTSARLAIADFTEQQTKTLGQELGAIGLALHSQSRSHVHAFKARFSRGNNLLTHIVKDKAGQVLREEADPDITRRVKVATDYLQQQCLSLADENTLSHVDFTLSNTQINEDARVMGIVDWGYFGWTHPSLSLYQLAIYPVWPHIKQEYENKGGMIREDIVYAAAAIHLAWTPIICRELGLPLEAEGPLESFDVMYDRFQSSKPSG